MISAEVITYSENPAGVRLLTMLLIYGRLIHSELMTHRLFSRNAASSRAIPLARMIRDIIDNPFIPEFWGANQSGMQANVELVGWAKWLCKKLWRLGRWPAIALAWTFSKIGLHKQLANRVLEPWAHITVLVTATEAGWANFFALRAHPDAQPEFQVLAYRALLAKMRTVPHHLGWGEWHIPYGDRMPANTNIQDQVKIGVARACWVSYNRVDKKEFHPEDAYERHDGSAKAGHWSPFEHCAQAIHFVPGEIDHVLLSNFDVDGEIAHWRQYRKSFKNEVVTKIDYDVIMQRKPDWVILN